MESADGKSEEPISADNGGNVIQGTASTPEPQMSKVTSVPTLDDFVQFLTSTGHSADDFFSACGVDSEVSDTGL
jgi:hypothetical protein